MSQVGRARAALAAVLLVGIWACGGQPPEAEATPAVAANAAAAMHGAGAGELPLAVVHRDPNCGCCREWISHLQANSFEVHDRETADIAGVKERLGVPARLGSCHTAEIDGYVIEGHVPAEVVQRLLDERPSDIAGLAVPGMPIGSPGMEVPGRPAQSYEIIAWDESGKTWVYDRR
ncbi:MAG: DUF411 domain-containing protein [Longimicrobiales bacterium]